MKFNAKNCLKKSTIAIYSKRKKERSLIEKCVKRAIKDGETDILYRIQCEQNVTWLKEKGFDVGLNNGLYNSYCVSWGDDNANK